MSSKDTSLLDRKERELEKLHDYLFENFSRLLGKEWPLGDIKSLMDNNIDYRDLEALLEQGCPKETAVRILL